ncbi:uncharacterized protein TM35_000181130 [Trypanosoma theileri]|uniref:Uncharacterized protein n=1 Tax=Trypanosoma theileri TaxID=67003 RepID=A0A1X0NTL8_9TRYP|nr:uncharacterized protein TM35_000181130 [Trypanosoma theileri]ORC88056.1 hypothetical protein TM35_000181130 [Trypanosoma theileri]
MNSRTKATPPPLVESEEVQIESFGRHLFDMFNKNVRPSIFDLQLRYYGDYLHHFGFSIEKEMRRQQQPSFAPSPTNGNGVQHLHQSRNGYHHNTLTPGMYDVGASVDDLVADAGWDIGKEEREEADAQARSVGPMEGCTKLEEVVAKIVEPYMQTSWRQNATQCAMKKMRAIYYWLCENMTVELPSPNAGGEETTNANTNNNANSHNVNTKAGNAAAGGGRRSAGRGGGRRPAAGDPPPPAPPPADPHVAALERRTADPTTLAGLYVAFLRAAGVAAEVVAGYLRGRAPGEVFPWAWNVVHIPHNEPAVRRYLVDVALSAYNGPLRPVTLAKDTAEEPEQAKTTAPKETSAPRSKRTGTIQEEKPKRGLLEGPTLLTSVTQTKHIESFYFNTHPEEFCATHLPNDGRHTLLMSAPRKVQWENAPCLTHTFFRFPLALSSHRRRCNFTARSTPFYVGLVNNKPEGTELCCVLFRGPLSELPEDCSTATSIGPQWVWHQREEATGCETFTMMVPEAGYYSIIIGARRIRKDPYSTVIADEPFLPVVAYQVLVTFVPCQFPQLPRQIFGPSVCKLFAPLTHQVSEGKTQFIVMPSCANVASVAVVSKRPSDGSRELLGFLPFVDKCVAYIGDVTLVSGTEVELWMLYAAPDHNYVNAANLPHMLTSFQPNVSPAHSDEDGNRDAIQQLTTPHTSRCDLLFVPVVMRIEVKKMIAALKGPAYIQPQPSLEEEQQLTLRRLIGVTSELYHEATDIAIKKSNPVGSYFAEKGLPRRKSKNV